MPLYPRIFTHEKNAIQFLGQVFFKDYNEVMTHYTPIEQLELTEHFIEMMNCLEKFASNAHITLVNAYEQSADALLIKYGSRFKPYTEKCFIGYFLLPLLLLAKGYYSEEQIRNGLAKPASKLEIAGFVFLSRSKLMQNRIELLINDAHKPIEKVISITDSNDVLNEDIESNASISSCDLHLNITEQLLPYRSYFNREADFNHCIAIVAQFFSTGKAYSGEVIFVKGGIIKKLAFALGEIWRSTTNEIISIEYLILYTRLFSIFNKAELDQSNIFCNNLYKYSISKT